ncbi:hypothetical protein FACS1894111_09770 [Clostridia bacterium]|nr:hypothetical protein FACS1894111_09770 [Clostridia bacterium]
MDNEDKSPSDYKTEQELSQGKAVYKTRSRLWKQVIQILSIMSIKAKRIIIGIILIVVIIGAISIYNEVTRHTERTIGNSLTPKELIETFEISTLDYEYSNVVFEQNNRERKFLFVELEDAIQMYAVRYDGSVKMGIDGKELKVDESYDGEGKILKITVPKAYIISHDAPLNDSAEVIYDVADHTENARIGQYIKAFNTYKKDTEKKIKENGLLDKAQESAKTQLESFLNAIPDIRDNYKLKFVLE